MKYLRLIIFCFLTGTALSLIGVFVLQSAGLIGSGDSDFRNLPYGIAVAFNLYLAFGTLPVLFNLSSKVRLSGFRSALSFFLLPFVFVLLSLLAMWDEPWPGMLFCVPYFAVLGFAFARFTRGVRGEDSGS